MTIALKVENLVLRYGGITAVKGVSFDVPEGSTVCLIGANGAGKTSIMRGISQLIRSREGSVRFYGEELNNIGSTAVARLGIAHIPEGRQIFSSLTVAENLRLGGLWIDRRKFASRLDEVLTIFPRLRERYRQLAGLLSGGEQQMLAMGRGLMADAKLLLMDEPSMGLAPTIVDGVFKVIADLRAQGRTILLVEQNAARALAVCDYAYVLESGFIKLAGTGAELAKDSSVVSAYLGSP